MVVRSLALESIESQAWGWMKQDNLEMKSDFQLLGARSEALNAESRK